MTFFNLLWIWFLLMVGLVVGLVLWATLGLWTGALWWSLAGFGLFRWRQWARKELHAREQAIRKIREARATTTQGTKSATDA